MEMTARRKSINQSKFYLKSVHFITIQHKLSRVFQSDLHCFKWTSDVSANNYQIKQPNAKISGTLGTTTICRS